MKKRETGFFILSQFSAENQSFLQQLVKIARPALYAQYFQIFFKTGLIGEYTQANKTVLR